jgi:DNA ligase D-like protein (predicted ligase)
MIPAPSPEPFDSSEHAFEVAWDGLRALVIIERATIRVQDRYGRDVSRLFPDLADLPGHLNGSGHVLDGEIVALDAAGRPDFTLLQPRLSATTVDVECLSEEKPVVFQTFDVLYQSGRSVMNEPLRTRKRILRQIVRLQGAIAVPDHVEGDGVAFFEAARQHELAGIVAKELESPYVGGRHSRAWQIIRVYPKDEFVIGGFTYGGPTRVRAGPYRSPPFHSLLVGQYDRWGQLGCAAEVSGGFGDDTVEQLSGLLENVMTARCPFNKPPTPERLVFWCEPVVAATIAFADRTSEGLLRFPKFEALRLDVPASACRIPDQGR